MDWRGKLDFTKEKEALAAAGRPSGWVEEVVDLNDPATLKVKALKSMYKSNCRHYDCFYLCGGIGSVKCKCCEELIPGIQLQKFCRDQYEMCPLYWEKEINEK